MWRQDQAVAARQRACPAPLGRETSTVPTLPQRMFQFTSKFCLEPGRGSYSVCPQRTSKWALGQDGIFHACTSEVNCTTCSSGAGVGSVRGRTGAGVAAADGTRVTPQLLAVRVLNAVRLLTRPFRTCSSFPARPPSLRPLCPPALPPLPGPCDLILSSCWAQAVISAVLASSYPSPATTALESGIPNKTGTTSRSSSVQWTRLLGTAAEEAALTATVSTETQQVGTTRRFFALQRRGAASSLDGGDAARGRRPRQWQDALLLTNSSCRGCTAWRSQTGGLRIPRKCTGTRLCSADPPSSSLRLGCFPPLRPWPAAATIAMDRTADRSQTRLPLVALRHRRRAAVAEQLRLLFQYTLRLSCRRVYGPALQRLRDCCCVLVAARLSAISGQEG
jgi:hypothetical protein